MAFIGEHVERRIDDLRGDELNGIISDLLVYHLNASMYDRLLSNVEIGARLRCITLPRNDYKEVTVKKH